MSWNDLVIVYNHITVMITKIGYGALVTMLTAELALASLLLAKRGLEKLGAYALMEKVGRVTTMLFFVPVVFWVIQIYHQGSATGDTSGILRARNDNAFMCTGNMWLVALAFLVVWIAVAAYRLKMMIHQRREEYDWLSKDGPAPLEWEDMLGMMRKEMGIRRPVKLSQRYGLGTAMTTGIVSYKVILPVRRYRQEELVATFAHELEHIRRKDVLFRLVLNVAESVFWFCPLLRILHPTMTKWSETCCDIGAGEQIGSLKTYVGVVAGLQPVAEGDVPGHGVCMADEEGIEERIMRMKMYQRGIKKKGRSGLLIVLSLVMVLCGSMTALAAGEGVAEFSNAIYVAAENVEVQEASDARVNDGIEYTETVEGTEDRVIIQNPVTSYFTNYQSIAWIVPADHIVQTYYFTATNGGYIEVVLKMEPTDKTVYVGIYTPGGTKRYVVVSGEVYHTFTLTESGPYMVFVENVSLTTDVEVVGGYFYE